MKNHKIYKPYIRLANGREKAETLRMSIRLAFYQLQSKPYYVMVQHGFPNKAMEVGRTKKDIIGSIVPVWAGWSTFKQWSADIQQKATQKHLKTQ